MYVRLAFSTAIHVDPEILIVDEALAVGDAIFANRCIKKFEELKERKVTVLFVSHDLGLVKRLSDRAALMLDGRVAAYGKPERSGEPLRRRWCSNGRSAKARLERTARRARLPPRRWREPRCSSVGSAQRARRVDAQSAAGRTGHHSRARARASATSTIRWSAC